MYPGARAFGQRFGEPLRDLAFRDDVGFEVDTLLRLPDGREFSLVKVLAIREYLRLAGVPLGRLGQRFECLDEVRRLRSSAGALEMRYGRPGANSARNSKPGLDDQRNQRQNRKDLEVAGFAFGNRLVRLLAVEHPREPVIDFVERSFTGTVYRLAKASKSFKFKRPV